MDSKTKNLIDLVAAWLGPVCVISYTLSWIVLGHNYPPPDFLHMTSQQLVDDYYVKYQTSLSLGMALSCITGLLYLPWSLLLASLINTRDGSYILTNMALIGGILTGYVLAACPAIWLVCSVYATEFHPDVIKGLHAFSWFIYDITFMITTIQVSGMGLYVILNKQQTIFPAWTGWAGVASGMIFLPLPLIAFAGDGPFAVGGLWNFIVVYAGWGIAFFLPYSYFSIKEIHRRRREISNSNIAADAG